MDISLFCTYTPETIRPDRQSEEATVRPKPRLSMRRMGANPKPRSRSLTRTVTFNDSVTVNHYKPLQRIPSTFRWRSSNDIVKDSLKGMTFTINGALTCLSADDVLEMIEFCGGTVYKTLAKKSMYLVTGINASKTWIKNAIESGKTVLDEKQFLELIKDKGEHHKFSKYREKKDSSDEDTVETLSDIVVISSDDSEDD